MHNFKAISGNFWSKFTEIYMISGGWGTALLFIRECVLGGTI